MEGIKDVLQPGPPGARRLQVVRARLARVRGQLRLAQVRALEDLDELVRGELLDLPERLGLLGRDERARLGVREELCERVAPAREEREELGRELLELGVGARVHVEERVRVGLGAVHELDDKVGCGRERDRGGREGRGGRRGRGVGPGLRRARLVEELYDRLPECNERARAGGDGGVLMRYLGVLNCLVTTLDIWGKRLLQWDDQSRYST